jgi:hypothetical protein
VNRSQKLFSVSLSNIQENTFIVVFGPSCWKAKNFMIRSQMKTILLLLMKIKKIQDYFDVFYMENNWS